MRWGGASMVARLRGALVCAPEAAGWGDPDRAGTWREAGYLHAPDAAAASRQHRAMRRALLDAGVRVFDLEDDGSLPLDAVYTHDASFVTGRGAILLRMGKPLRRGEPDAHARFYEGVGIPVRGRIVEPGCVEGGDLVWLDERTLLAGRGYRTNAEGIAQLEALLPGVRVVRVPLPHGRGPEHCLHLMSLISLLDERTALVDLPMLPVETVELLRSRGVRAIEIEPAERDTLAANALSLGEGRVLALSQNRRTNERMRRAGFEVVEFDGAEIAVCGGGGPTCLTRPLERG